VGKAALRGLASTGQRRIARRLRNTMQCSKCGTVLGANFLLCPKCGTRASATSSNLGRPSLPVVSSVAPPLPATLTTPVAHGPIPLPPLPTRSPTLFRILLALVTALVVAALLVVMNQVLSEVRGTLETRFEGNWERIALKARFIEANWFGTNELNPKNTTFEIVRSSGASIYQGTEAIATISDTELGNEEIVQARACMTTTPWYSNQLKQHCATSPITTSAKRYASMAVEVNYPRGGAVELPTIAFQQEVQRVVFGQSEQWSRLRVLDDPVRLKVWIADSADQYVQLHVTPSRAYQTIDLREGDGYPSFAAAYQRAQSVSADVGLHFQFFTSTATDAAPYPPKQVILRGKSQEERLRELQALADRAGRHIVGKYYDGGSNITSQVMEWRFDSATRAFTSILRISWNGIIVKSNSYWMQGNLTVSESGGDSKFEITREGGDFSAANRMFSKITARVGDVLRSVVAQ
jgi:hypothetical protein